MRFDPPEWELRVARAIEVAIRSANPRSWKEDLITDRVLSALLRRGRPLEIMVPWYRSAITITWDAFKLAGPLETDRGDIAVLVARRFQNGEVLEGVAFLEAKRLYPGTKTFEGMRHWEQLERMQRLAAHHQVLLYDTEPHYAEGEAFGNHIWFWGPKHLAPLSTRAIVVPTNFVLATRSRSRDLYRQGNALAHQICRRYISGFDLEYESSAVLEAKGYLDGIGGPSYLVILTIQLAEGEPLEVTVNTERYSRMARPA